MFLEYFYIFLPGVIPETGCILLKNNAFQYCKGSNIIFWENVKGEKLAINKQFLGAVFVNLLNNFGATSISIVYKKLTWSMILIKSVQKKKATTWKHKFTMTVARGLLAIGGCYKCNTYPDIKGLNVVLCRWFCWFEISWSTASGITWSGIQW